MKHIAVLLWVLAAPALAQTAEPVAEEEKRRIQALTQDLHERARQLRAAAERQHAAAEKDCWNKFLVSACLDEARKLKSERDREAKRIEREARDLEHDLKRRELAAKEAQRAEEAPRREAEATERAAKNRAEKEEALRRVEKKQAEAAARGK